jgi:y4mF family transcriptional regulator
MKYTPEQIGELVKNVRKQMGVTQRALAMISGTGLRFIIEMEKGKSTCQLGKVLTVLQTLGIQVNLAPPAAARLGKSSPKGAKHGAGDDVETRKNS